MPRVIDNKATGDAYTAACTIEGMADSSGGYAIIANNPVYCEIQSGPPGQQQFSREFPINAAVAASQVQPHATGIRFRSRNAGQPAIVYAVLFESNEPAIIGSTFDGTINTSGNVTPFVALPDIKDTSLLFVWLSTNKVFGPGGLAFRTVPYNTVVQDQAAGWDAPSFQYIIPKPGWWQIHVGAMLGDATAAADPLALAVYANGSQIQVVFQQEFPVTGGNNLAHGSTALPFSAGEHITIMVESQSGNNTIVAGFQSFLCMYQAFTGG